MFNGKAACENGKQNNINASFYCKLVTTGSFSLSDNNK